MKIKDPCNGCNKDVCPDMSCKLWQKSFCRRQSLINAYAVKVGTRNPCLHCSAEPTCDTICRARADYWDGCIQAARRKIAQARGVL